MFYLTEYTTLHADGVLNSWYLSVSTHHRCDTGTFEHIICFSLSSWTRIPNILIMGSFVTQGELGKHPCCCNFDASDSGRFGSPRNMKRIGLHSRILACLSLLMHYSIFNWKSFQQTLPFLPFLFVSLHPYSALRACRLFTYSTYYRNVAIDYPFHQNRTIAM